MNKKQKGQTRAQGLLTARMLSLGGEVLSPEGKIFFAQGEPLDGSTCNGADGKERPGSARNTLQQEKLNALRRPPAEVQGKRTKLWVQKLAENTSTSRKKVLPTCLTSQGLFLRRRCNVKMFCNVQIISQCQRDQKPQAHAANLLTQF